MFGENGSMDESATDSVSFLTVLSKARGTVYSNKSKWAESKLPSLMLKNSSWSFPKSKLG